MIKIGGKMKSVEIILLLFPVIWITILLQVNPICGQTTDTPTVLPTTISSVSTMPPSPMTAGENDTTSTTTMAMMTAAGGDNSTTEGTITNLTTLAVPNQQQTTPSMNGDNITTTLPSSDMGNTTSMPDMGNATSMPDMGNATSMPNMVNATSNPVAENTTSPVDMVNTTSTPDMGNTTSPTNKGNSTSPSDMGNTTSSRDSNATETFPTGSMTTSDYVTVTLTAEYTVLVTDGLEGKNVTDTATTESNSTFTANTGNFTIMFTTVEPETTSKDDNGTRKRSGPSIPVALYMCISVILALCVVLLMGVIAHACASMRNRPTSYNISSRVNGHQNPAFDSGEVADDDEDNPVKGIMREPRGDIESGMYSDNERTPL